MPDNDRGGEDFAKEQLEVLEQQQTDLQASYEADEISLPDFKKEKSKIAFQIAQLKARQEQDQDKARQQERGVRFERQRDVCGD